MAEAPRIGAIVLAAGSSSRMGLPKQTLQYQGQSLLMHAARNAIDGGCYPVIVVLGAHKDECARELDSLDVREVFNEEWKTGIASSIRAGVDGLLVADKETAATVILLCDQPHVTANLVSELIDCHRVTGSPIVASAYGESFGVPALFMRDLFRELTQLDGTSGAKQVIKKYVSEAHFIPFPGGEVDVDTPEDFSRLTFTKPRKASLSTLD